ncbi:MAG: fasciclin domain-containing protein [Odoribacter sp.]|nr:fasciclin domain-containing protein [Odoribacter sp.]
MAEIVRKWDVNEGIVNGIVYEIEDIFRKNTDMDVVGLLKERYMVFYQKLKEAGLINENDVFTEIEGDRVICFAPKNEVLEALTLPTDKEELAYYLRYYFIPSNINRLSDYLLPNYGMLEGIASSVQLQTLQKLENVRDGNEIIVKQYNEKSIVISNLQNEEVITDGHVPFFATDGLVYGIDNPIESKR